MIPLGASALALGRSWWKAALGAAVVAGPAFLLGQCSGAANERGHAEAAAAVAVQGALKIDGAAKEVAAGERLADERAVTAQTKEMIDAVAAIPDETPDAVAVRLGCQRLRNAGKDVSNLPACR